MSPASIGAEPGVQTPTRTAEGKPRHLYEVDVLRILTFACVIGVHTTSHTAAADDVGLNALLALLHFTRLVFFSLTAFVLVYSYTLRPQPMAQFWPKRFLLVGVPYLAWSFVYVAAAWLLSRPAVATSRTWCAPRPRASSPAPRGTTCTSCS